VEQWGQFLPFVLIAVLFWLLIVRPARRRQQEVSRTQAQVAEGVEVMIGAGIFGRVVALGDDTVDLEVAPGVQLKVARAAVVRVIEPDTPDEA
jgi:preprotein translocase subunit YajC